MLQTNGIIPTPDYEWYVRRAAETELDSLPFRQEVVRQLGVAVLSAVTLFTGTQAVDQHMLYFNNPVCDTPDATEQARLTDMLRADVPVVESFRYDVGYQDEYYRSIGESYGVTVPGFRQEFADLYNEVYEEAGEQASGKAYLERAQTWFAQYGIRFGVDPADVQASEGVRAIDDEDIESAAFKKDLYDIIASVGILPTEFADYWALDSIVYQHGITPVTMSNGDELYPVASYHYENRQIVLQFGQGSGGVFRHELGHAVDEGLGCLMTNDHDPHWEALNPQLVYQSYRREGQNAGNAVSAEHVTATGEYWDRVEALANSIVYEDDTREAIRLLHEHEERSANITATTDYGLTRPTEDKAEIFGDVHASAMGERESTRLTVLDAMQPVVLSKVLTWLHRIDTVSPGIAGYMTNILPSVQETGDVWFYEVSRWHKTRQQMRDNSE